MRAFARPLIIGLLVILSSCPVFAVDPAEQLKDSALEARAREISAGLRCLVCQNQSIDDSDASLAKDLRVLVRQRLEKGDSNAEVVDYIVARYGEFVLLKPRLRLNTILLWFAPFVFVIGGILLASRVLKRPRQAEARARPLSPEEEAELRTVLSPSDRTK